MPLNNTLPAQHTLQLAPMEGVLDNILRDLLTRLGHYDRCVSEFIRINNTNLPPRNFCRVVPELLNKAKTASGTPVAVQLLGKDPDLMGNNAARLSAWKPAAIDLNFGCPAPTVNRHGGGVVLMDDPDLLFRIAHSVRQQVPKEIPVTAKMRLGHRDDTRGMECALALQEAGLAELTIHGRLGIQGYRGQALWKPIGQIKERLAIPVVANGDIKTVDDWLRCIEESGCRHVMLGRGAVSDPFLVNNIRQHPKFLGLKKESPDEENWPKLLTSLGTYIDAVQKKLERRFVPGRIKLWLGYLAQSYPAAEAAFVSIRPLKTIDEVKKHLDKLSTEKTIARKLCQTSGTTVSDRTVA